MAVGFRPTLEAAANFSDNLCRWASQSAGHREAWLLALGQRASQRGFCFRYGLRCPSGAAVEGGPRAAVWAAVFDRSRPAENFSLRREYPIEEFAFDGGERFCLKVGEALFGSSHAAGSLSGGGRSLDWSLSFTPNQKTYQHFARSIGRLALPSTTICAPNPDTKFSGTVTVDGHEIALEGEPGFQSHLWGRKQIDDWVWVHANDFDNHPMTVFEGMNACLRRAGRRMPPLQSLLLKHRGEEHHFVRLRMAEQWQRNLGIGYWAFSAMNRHVYIEGSAQCRLRDMLQVEERDPDGEKFYSITSKIANLKIRLFRRVHGVRWRHVETITARATAHLEHASRAAEPGVRMAL
jgi:hypothetical protein